MQKGGEEAKGKLGWDKEIRKKLILTKEQNYKRERNGFTNAFFSIQWKKQTGYLSVSAEI